jgi:hypothetical protein
MLIMTWQQFCAWCTKNGFNPPTVIKGVSGRDASPYYVRITWGSGRDQGSKGYGIAAQTPTPAELQEIVNNPCLP